MTEDAVLSLFGTRYWQMTQHMYKFELLFNL